MSASYFDHILGQDRALEVLTSAVRSGRVHHAWVFHGPAGVGKRTAAEAFAAGLLDPGARVDDRGALARAERTEAGRLLDQGAHPDLHVITKEMARFSEDSATRSRKLISIPKEVIDRHLLTPAHLAPSMNAGSIAKKVFLVDEAELLNAPTQNAILKTLEEPPTGTVIILVTSSEDRLLATIRSRCQRVAFRPLDAEAMRAWLDRSDLSLSEDEAEWLLGFARGSPGLATLAHESGLHEWAQRLRPMLKDAEAGRYRADLGPAMAKMVDEWASSWVERHKDQNPSKDAANKAGAQRLFDLLAERARLRLRRAIEQDSDAAEPMRCIDLIGSAERQLAANVNMGHVMENLSTQLARGVGSSAGV